MAVYVDDMNATFRRMVMSHMVADTKTELLAMAAAIGVQWKWIQHEDTAKEHFDISLGMKDKAQRAGAILVTWRQLTAMCFRRRILGHLGDPATAEQWMKDYMQAQKDAAAKPKRRRKA